MGNFAVLMVEGTVSALAKVKASKADHQGWRSIARHSIVHRTKQAEILCVETKWSGPNGQKADGATGA